MRADRPGASKHPPQPFQAGSPPAGKGRQQDLSVRSRTERVVRQLPAQVLIVVDFTIEHDRDARRRVRERLPGPIILIHDGKSRMEQLNSGIRALPMLPGVGSTPLQEQECLAKGDAPLRAPFPVQI